MKRVSKLVVYGLVTTAIGFASARSAIALTIISTNINPLPSWATDIAQATQTTTPKRLTITVKGTEPDHLKVSEGEQVEKGEIIADRERERIRLTAQQKQL
ncbi:hypothetical protein [Myxosarcina sp. GI1(2024)]